MKFIHYSICSAVLLSLSVSCSDEDNNIVDFSGLADGKIVFCPYMTNNAMGRGEVLASSSLTNFGVFAYYNGSLKSDWMYNQQVSKSGGAWEYDPIKYWPSDIQKTIDFVAYAPYSGVISSISDTESGITDFVPNNDEEAAWLRYSVGTDVENQVDLCYASKKGCTNKTGPVNLVFNHALSRLAFKVVGWEPGTGETFDNNTTVTINSVKIATKRRSAVLTLESGEWSSPEDAGELRAYTLNSDKGNIRNNVIVSGDTDSKPLNLADDYIFMLPDLHAADGCADLDEYIVFVDYTVNTEDPNLNGGAIYHRNNVYKRLKPGFEAGKAYNIIIHLGMNGYSGDDDSADDGNIPEEPDKSPESPEVKPAGKNGYVAFSTEVTSWQGGDEFNLTLSDDHAMIKNLVATQQDFDIVGTFEVPGMSRSRAEAPVVGKITGLQSTNGDNVLSEEIPLTSTETYIIPGDKIDWGAVDYGQPYRVVAEDNNGVQLYAGLIPRGDKMTYFISVEKGETVPLPLAAGTTFHKLAIDYGDGKRLTNVTMLDENNLNHTYTRKGIYLVSISCLEDNPAAQKISYRTAISLFPQCVTSVNTHLLCEGRSTIAHLDNCFNGCSKLLSLPSNLFENFRSISSAECIFNGCNKLTSIPSSFSEKLTGAPNLIRAFKGCSSLLRVPALWESKSIYDWSGLFECFKGCTSALNRSKIPAYMGGSQEPETVDLGLPSGNLWATCNIGASSPESYGAYFEWGEVTPTPMPTAGYATKIESLDELMALGIIDENLKLTSKYDAATSILGGRWQMPDWDDITELLNNCVSTYIRTGENPGLILTSKFNSKSIFLPATGSKMNRYTGDYGSYYTNQSYVYGWPYELSFQLNPDLDYYWSGDDWYNRRKRLTIRPVKHK